MRIIFNLAPRLLAVLHSNNIDIKLKMSITYRDKKYALTLKNCRTTPSTKIRDWFHYGTKT